MGDMGDLFRDLKEFSKEKRSLNKDQSKKILDNADVEYRALSDDHYRIYEFDFWPSTGLFINRKTKRRGRGVFNLLKILRKAGER